MASGLINGTVSANSSQYKCYIEWSSTSNIQSNTSTVTANAYLESIGNYNCDTVGEIDVTIGIYYESKTFKKRVQCGPRFEKRVLLASWTREGIEHGADGSCYIGIAFTANILASSWGPNYCEAHNDAVLLDVIPRASTIWAGDFTLGENPTFTINRASDSFTHYVSLYANGDWITGESYTGTSGEIHMTEDLNNNLYNRIPQATSLPCLFECGTHDQNGNLIGVTYWNVYGNLAIDSARPIFSDFSYEDTNSSVAAVTGDNQTLVSGLSNLKVTIPASTKATAQKGAYMVKYILTCGDRSQEASWSADSDVTFSLDGVTDGTLTVTAVDSRGLETTVSKSAPLIAYTKPAIRSAQVVRADGVGEETRLDLSIQVYTSETIGQTENAVQSISYRYRKTGTDEWMTGATPIPAQTSVSQPICGDIDAGFTMAQSFDLEVTVRDVLTSASTLLQVNSGVPVMDMYRKDNIVGISIGGLYNPEVGGMLQLEGKTPIEFGNNDKGNYIKFPNGIMFCWIRKNIHIPPKSETMVESSMWIDLPQPYINGDYVATVTASEKKAWVFSCECFDTSLKLWLLDENAQDVFGGSCEVGISIIGRWK